MIDEMFSQTYYLADCKPCMPTPCAPPCCETAPVKKAFPWKNKKDESPMNYASATVIAQDTTDRDQRRYLNDQLESSYYATKTALEHKFGLSDDDAPATMEEFVKRISDGLFVLPEKYKNRPGYASSSYLRWRDPAVVEDKAGFEAAKNVLKTARNDAQRVIQILTPAEGLKALKDFEAANAAK